MFVTFAYLKVGAVSTIKDREPPEIEGENTKENDTNKYAQVALEVDKGDDSEV